MRRVLLCAAGALLAAAGSLAGCGRVSYQGERVAQALSDLCKKEYGLDVRAAFVETTLGALVEIPGLVDELQKHVPSTLPELPPVFVESRATDGGFNFRVFTRGQYVRVRGPKTAEEDRPPQEPAEPFKKLQHVSTAILRVCLSTDAPVEFYKLIARDPGPKKLDLVLAGHILDSKRVQFYVISIGELQRRNEISMRWQPEEVARTTAAGFLGDLRMLTLVQLLTRYVAPSKRFGEMSQAVTEAALHLKGQEQAILGEQEAWPVRQIREDEVLVYVSLKRIGEPGALLIHVQLQEGSEGKLLAIQALDGSGLPAAHAGLGPPERWRESFYLQPLSLREFISEQIAKRAMSEFKSIPPEAEEVPKDKLAGSEEVTQALAGAAAYVTKSYDFQRFEQVTVVDALQGTRWEISAADLPFHLRRNPPELKPIQ